MPIDSNKTYIGAALLVAFGAIGAPLLAKTATIGDPGGGVAFIVGGVAILLAINNASLRHAIAKLERRLPPE